MENFLGISLFQWLLAAVAAFIIGLSKAGLKGIDMMNVTLMALVFGGKASTGVVLPLLCLADILAVNYYHRHAQWHHFWKLIPWMAVGILAGVVTGQYLNEVLFRKAMAIIILFTAAVMVWLEYRKTLKVPEKRSFGVVMGLVSGFTTMLGNLAGAFSNIYFLAMRLPKNDFIGTAAWVFLVINLFKLPFQVLVWKNIDGQSLLKDLVLLPFIGLGFWAGIQLVAKIEERYFRRIVIALTLVGAIFIFVK
jgi:uncharacterized protein